MIELYKDVVRVEKECFGNFKNKEF
jgi:hypothetical protein